MRRKIDWPWRKYLIVMQKSIIRGANKFVLGIEMREAEGVLSW